MVEQECKNEKLAKDGVLRRSPNQFEILLLEVLGGGAGGRFGS